MTSNNLIQINNLGEINSILICTHQLNQYHHTLLGNPFERLKYYNFQTKQYQFYRTPGILNYIIQYYLHQGCLTTDVNIPVEILYDELIFFGFHYQIIYEILSNLITIEYYIPSGKYRRACWTRFDYYTLRKSFHPFRILSGLMTFCSILTSIAFVDLSDYLFYKVPILICEIFLLIFFYFEILLEYFIRPKFYSRKFLLIIHCCSLFPFGLFLYFWILPPKWFYPFLVLQFATRLIRSLRLSIRAYEIISTLTNHFSIYFELFQSITLLNLVFALFIFSIEQCSSRQNQSLNDMLWISFNAFTSLGEGTKRPRTFWGLIMEFLVCFIGVLIIPQLVQQIYMIVSNVIEKDRINNEKRQKTHLVLIEDEYGHQAIGQVNVDQQGNCSLPEILIDKNEF